MGLSVQKFGGTSVANAERVRAAAKRIVETYKAGNQVIVVVSARGQTTDELIDLAHDRVAAAMHGLVGFTIACKHHSRPGIA